MIFIWDIANCIEFRYSVKITLQAIIDGTSRVFDAIFSAPGKIIIINYLINVMSAQNIQAGKNTCIAE